MASTSHKPVIVDLCQVKALVAMIILSKDYTEKGSLDWTNHMIMVAIVSVTISPHGQIFRAHNRYKVSYPPTCLIVDLSNDLLS